MAKKIATIGVYGTTKESFFAALSRFGATHFADIRRRRGMRGSRYAYANSSALQQELAACDIEYLHELGLAPTKETRDAQKTADKALGEHKAARSSLSPRFIDRFGRESLATFDFNAFLKQFPDGARIVLFCVEHDPLACHRSLAAEELAKANRSSWEDITPAR